MIQQSISIVDRNITQPLIPTLRMVVMAEERISAIPIDGWGSLQALEFIRLIDDLSEQETSEEMNSEWHEN
jgi:hypothetical protein